MKVSHCSMANCNLCSLLYKEMFSAKYSNEYSFCDPVTAIDIKPNVKDSHNLSEKVT